MLTLKNMDLQVQTEISSATPRPMQPETDTRKLALYYSYIDFLTLPEDRRQYKTLEEWRIANKVHGDTMRRWEDSETFLIDYWARLRRNLAKYINFASVLVQFQNTKDYLNIAKDIITPAREQPTPQIINIENMTINQLNNMLVNLEKYIDE